MIVDINKMTLDNIHLYSILGNIRKRQHLTNQEKEFLDSFKNNKTVERQYKKRTIMPRTKLSEEQRKKHIKEYQHKYYLEVTKSKRKEKKNESR